MIHCTWINVDRLKNSNFGRHAQITTVHLLFMSCVCVYVCIRSGVKITLLSTHWINLTVYVYIDKRCKPCLFLALLVHWWGRKWTFNFNPVFCSPFLSHFLSSLQIAPCPQCEACGWIYNWNLTAIHLYMQLITCTRTIWILTGNKVHCVLHHWHLIMASEHPASRDHLASTSASASFSMHEDQNRWRSVSTFG